MHDRQHDPGFSFGLLGALGALLLGALGGCSAADSRAPMTGSPVDDLPPHYREILLLSYFQKLSYNQISDSLQIPHGTVKSRLHSAVAHFADAWRAETTREQRRRDDGGSPN